MKKKSLLATAVLAVALLGSSAAFAGEPQTSMQQEFSAFNGVETFDVSKSQLDQVSGEFAWLYYAAVYGVPASYAIARWATSPTGSSTIARVINRFR